MKIFIKIGHMDIPETIESCAGAVIVDDGTTACHFTNPGFAIPPGMIQILRECVGRVIKNMGAFLMIKCNE